MYRQLVLVTLVFAFLNLNFCSYLNWSRTHVILGDWIIPAPVAVSADIDYRPLLLIKPEKRIPPVNNDSLLLDVVIRPAGTGTSVFSQSVTTDNDGSAHLGPIPSSLITGQYYDVLIKGMSHLRRLFPSQDFHQGAGLTLDLRTPVLFAGDSHPNSDNYVNSMDISYEIQKLYSNDLRADLNRDTTVNSLEFPTVISHLYQNGDN